MEDVIYRIEKALLRMKKNGRRVTKKELAKKIWPDSSPAAQAVNMTNLMTGRTAHVRPEWVKAICEELEMTPNELFGYEE